uniref:Uncharacterized protein n=1 Tax=Myotis myotis TaxID=51298 RepID=A0A7J7S259_MYOMY|nr:hypothetical protein mMyoMyo1_010085 [Myotis myotis]
MCPDWESNLGPFSPQADALSTEPNRRGQSVMNFNKQRPRRGKISYQQLHMNTLSHMALNHPDGLTKRQVPLSYKGSQPVFNLNVNRATENKKQPRQTYTETEYKNFGILWNFHASPDSPPVHPRARGWGGSWSCTHKLWGSWSRCSPMHGPQPGRIPAHSAKNRK